MANLLMQTDVDEVWQMYSHFGSGIKTYQCGKCRCGFGENSYTGRKTFAPTFCPSCGLAAHPEFIKSVSVDKNLYPIKSRFSVKSTKEKVILECVFVAGNKVSKEESISYHNYCTNYRKVIEVFTINIATGKSTWSQSTTKEKGPDIDISNLFEVDYFNKSLLFYYTGRSHAFCYDKSRFTEIIKCLRDNVKRKLEAKFKKKLNYSIYTSVINTPYGFFLPAIKLMTLANSLPYFNDYHRLASYEFLHDPFNCLSKGTVYGHDYKLYYNELAKSRKDATIQMWLKNFKFPNTSAIRSGITNNIFDSAHLEQAFLIFNNYDYAISLSRRQSFFDDDFKVFMRDAIDNLDEKRAFEIYQHSSYFEDTVKMYANLRDESRKILWEKKL